VVYFAQQMTLTSLSLAVDILSYLLNPEHRGKCEFVMEVTDKTRADVKVCEELYYFVYVIQAYVLQSF